MSRGHRGANDRLISGKGGWIVRIDPIGRSRVCALHKCDVELPSDYDGVIYVPMDDAGGWRLLLAREIKLAGLAIDLNVAM